MHPVKTYQPGELPNLTRVFTVGLKKRWVLGYPQNVWRRLGRCPGWSESLLGAQAILLVLLCCGSNNYVVINQQTYCTAPARLIAELNDFPMFTADRVLAQLNDFPMFTADRVLAQLNDFPMFTADRVFLLRPVINFYNQWLYRVWLVTRISSLFYICVGFMVYVMFGKSLRQYQGFSYLHLGPRAVRFGKYSVWIFKTGKTIRWDICLKSIKG